MEDRALAEKTIQYFAERDWKVVTQTTNGIQFSNRPEPDVFLIITGILTLPFCIGLFLLFMAFARKERVEFITYEQMREGKVEAYMRSKYPSFRTPLKKNPSRS